MPRPRSAANQSHAARAVWFAGAVFSALLSGYWLVQIGAGGPQAYRGQRGGGLLLSIAVLLGCLSHFVGSPRLRVVVVASCLVPLAAFWYFFLPSGG